MTTDWVSRDDVRAKLRSTIKRLLDRYGYPPDAEPAATELVLHQMETYAEERSPTVSCSTVKSDDLRRLLKLELEAQIGQVLARERLVLTVSHRDL